MSNVLKNFRCKVTKKLYKAGEAYDGERTKELQDLGYVEATEDNELTEFPKHTDGGWYELSNGEKVKGKDEAIEAQKALEE